MPVDFIAKEEGYRFLLPGANVRPYPRRDRDDARDRSRRATRSSSSGGRCGTSAPEGRVVGERLDLRGRQTASEIREILRGKVLEHLFVREQLIETSAGAASPR